MMSSSSSSMTVTHHRHHCYHHSFALPAEEQSGYVLLEVELDYQPGD